MSRVCDLLACGVNLYTPGKYYLTLQFSSYVFPCYSSFGGCLNRKYLFKIISTLEKKYYYLNTQNCMLKELELKYVNKVNESNWVKLK